MDAIVVVGRCAGDIRRRVLGIWRTRVTQGAVDLVPVVAA
jgi:hypothetical protein